MAPITINESKLIVNAEKIPFNIKTLRCVGVVELLHCCIVVLPVALLLRCCAVALLRCCVACCVVVALLLFDVMLLCCCAYVVGWGYALKILTNTHTLMLCVGIYA